MTSYRSLLSCLFIFFLNTHTTDRGISLSGMDIVQEVIRHSTNICDQLILRLSLQERQRETRIQDLINSSQNELIEVCRKHIAEYEHRKSLVTGDRRKTKIQRQLRYWVDRLATLESKMETETSTNIDDSTFTTHDTVCLENCQRSLDNSMNCVLSLLKTSTFTHDRLKEKILLLQKNCSANVVPSICYQIQCIIQDIRSSMNGI